MYSCLSYTACNAHVPYCHLWPVRLYHIFPHYLINGAIFVGGGGLLNIECVFLFSRQVSSQTFLILRKIQRDITNTHRSSCSSTQWFAFDPRSVNVRFLTDRVALRQALLRVFRSNPFQYIFHQCFALVFIYTLLLPEGQTGAV